MINEAKILVMDRTMQLANALKESLNGDGGRVIFTPTIANSLRLLLGGDPYLTILSSDLPPFNSLDVIRTLKLIRPHLPMIFIDMLQESDLEREVRRQGVLLYMSWPIDMKRVLAAVFKGLEYAGQREAYRV